MASSLARTAMAVGLSTSATFTSLALTPAGSAAGPALSADPLGVVAPDDPGDGPAALSPPQPAATNARTRATAAGPVFLLMRPAAAVPPARPRPPAGRRP